MIPNEVEIDKKDSFTEPDGQNDTGLANRLFSHVSTYQKLLSFKPRIYYRSEKRLYWSPL